MHSPKLLIAALATVSIVGAATFAVAQTPPAQPMEAQKGTTGTMQRDGQPMNPATTGNPSSTTTPRAQGSTPIGNGNMGTSPTDRMQRDGGTGAAGMNSGSNTGTSGGSTTMQNGGMRSSTDARTMTAERPARADRN